MALNSPTRRETRAQKRAAMYDARVRTAQTGREQIGHAMDYIKAALDGCDAETARTVTAQLLTIGNQYNGRFERKGR